MLLLLPWLFARSVAALPPGGICSDMATAMPDLPIETAPQANYYAEQIQYWSRACVVSRPTCILAPKSADQVSAIIKGIQATGEDFAIKSGGHNPNYNFSCIDKGPLLSTKNLNIVKYDPETRTVRVGPGNRWNDVMKGLDGTGRTVVGGRIGHVGVGGYLLGNGLSYLSAQHGWAANNVVEMEVVVADGSVVRANSQTNPDLFKALKGGGRNFGFVTEFVLQTYPQGTVTAGVIVYNDEQTPKLLDAMRDFVEYYPDEKTGLILTKVSTLSSGVRVWSLFVMYDGEEIPSGLLDNFTSIPFVTNTVGKRKYADFLDDFDIGSVGIEVYSIFVESTPLPDKASSAEVLGSLHSHWQNITKSLSNSVSGVLATFTIQPFSKRFAQRAIDNGGDLLGLDASVDRVFVEFNYAYFSEEDTPKVDQAIQNVYGGFRDIVTKFQQEGKLPDAYLPLFMNDAYWRQDYFGRLKPESIQLARSVRAKYDPDGFWELKTKGWAIP